MTTQQLHNPPAPTDPRLVGFELNLDRNLIFVPKTFKGKSIERTFVDTMPDGSVVTRTFTIGKTHKGEEVGVLIVSSHYPLTLVLHELWEDAGRPSDQILSHTLYEITKTRGVAPESDRNKLKTVDLLQDLYSIPLRGKKSWFIKAENAYAEQIKPFTILDYLDIYTKTFKKDGREYTKGLIRWKFHRTVLDSLRENHVHPTRKASILGIKKHRDTAIPMYQFIDRTVQHVAPDRMITFALPNFWKQATGFDCPDYADKRDLRKRAKAVIDQATSQELSRGGYPKYELHLNSKKTNYNVLLGKVADDSAVVQKRQDALSQRMIKAGFLKKTVKLHLSTLDPAMIEQWLDAIPLLKAQGIEKPAGYIHKALTNGDPLPDKFLPKKASPQAKEMQERARISKERLDREDNARVGTASASAEEAKQALSIFLRTDATVSEIEPKRSLSEEEIQQAKQLADQYNIPTQAIESIVLNKGIEAARTFCNNLESE